jgi:hypothetical protein
LPLVVHAIVDPKTGLSETGRIYEDDGTNYNVVLNMSGTPTSCPLIHLTSAARSMLISA